MIKRGSSTIDSKQILSSKSAASTLAYKLPLLEKTTFWEKMKDALGSEGLLHLYWLVPTSGHSNICIEAELS